MRGKSYAAIGKTRMVCKAITRRQSKRNGMGEPHVGKRTQRSGKDHERAFHARRIVIELKSLKFI
jgi:hypothetical protein